MSARSEAQNFKISAVFPPVFTRLSRQGTDTHASIFFTQRHRGVAAHPKVKP
jgi:hypothetical protein